MLSLCLDLRYELLLIECADLFPLLQSLIEALKALELGEDRSIELLNTLESLIPDGFLVVREEEPPEVLV